MANRFVNKILYSRFGDWFFTSDPESERVSVIWTAVVIGGAIVLAEGLEGWMARPLAYGLGFGGWIIAVSCIRRDERSMSWPRRLAWGAGLGVFIALLRWMVPR